MKDFDADAGFGDINCRDHRISAKDSFKSNGITFAFLRVRKNRASLHFAHLCLIHHSSTYVAVHDKVVQG
jgi:hypothetical protein